MNPELQLKLQASLDGELPESEARSLAGRVAGDAGAQQLLAELTMTKAALAGNELEIKLPESRDFYWSKIRREIERAEARPERPADGAFPGWQRFLTPLAAVGLVALLAIGTARFYTNPTPAIPPSYEAEINSPSEDSSSFSFRSQSENMYVVWVYDRNDESPANPERIEDTDIQ